MNSKNLDYNHISVSNVIQFFNIGEASGHMNNPNMKVLNIIVISANIRQQKKGILRHINNLNMKVLDIPVISANIRQLIIVVL